MPADPVLLRSLRLKVNSVSVHEALTGDSSYTLSPADEQVIRTPGVFNSSIILRPSIDYLLSFTLIESAQQNVDLDALRRLQVETGVSVTVTLIHPSARENLVAPDAWFVQPNEGAGGTGENPNTWDLVLIRPIRQRLG